MSRCQEGKTGELLLLLFTGPIYRIPASYTRGTMRRSDFFDYVYLQDTSPVLGPDMTMNSGASLYPITALPIPPPTPGPPHPPPWGQHPPPVLNPSFLPGSSVLPAFPRPQLVTGNGGLVTSGTGGDKVIIQIRKLGGPAEPPPTQPFVLPQMPHILTDPRVLCGGAQQAPPGILRASPGEPFIPGLAVGCTQAAEGGWTPGLPPQAPPPAAQLAPSIPPGNAFSRPQGPSREGGPPSTQSKDDSCNPKSVYQNFRRWQSFKSLARRHIRLSPDAEALSCFLIPVLRSLARQKPTMTLEEGLQLAVQEWRHTSNFDRMIYYEMAAKFKEFEMEEERQIQMLKERNGFQHPPPPAPPYLHPQVPPGTVGGQKPVPIPKRPGPKAEVSRQRKHRYQQTLKTKAPKEIPPEAVKEYIDLMDGLVGPVHPASKGEDGKWEEEEHGQQEDDGMYADPDLLSYIDQLCAEEDFITKVEAVIHPRFLEELLSPGAHIDFLSLTEELQQEEGLTPTQLVEKRLLSFKDVKGVEAPPSYDIPGLGSVPSMCKSSNGTENKADHGQLLGVKVNTDALYLDGRADNNLDLPKDIAVSPRSLEDPQIIKKQISYPHQHQRHSSPRFRRRDHVALQETYPVSTKSKPTDGSNEEEDEELPSLAFLLAPRHHLLPWGLVKSPFPRSGRHTSGVKGTCGASLSVSSVKRGHNQTPHPDAKPPSTTLVEGSSSAESKSHLRADFGASGRHIVALGASQSSQPPKRRCDQLSDHRKKKPRCRE
nr:NUT family member 2G [Dasypus novemcinctus]